MQGCVVIVVERHSRLLHLGPRDVILSIAEIASQNL
jgi:hypothetical protein